MPFANSDKNDSGVLKTNAAENDLQNSNAFEGISSTTSAPITFCEEASQIELLQARIAELEMENSKLKKEKESENVSRNIGYFSSLQATNLYDNLNDLQIKLKDNLKERFKEGMAKWGQLNLDLRFYDLKPYVEAAARWFLQ